MKKLGLAALIIMLLLIGVVAVGNHLILDKIGPESVPRDLALQDDSKVVAPVVQPAANGEAPSSGGELNLYWGELHLHTAESFDSSMMGNKLGVEDAYRFAKGESLIGAGGERMQLSRPLDFVAITDHAESFGIRAHCKDSNLSLLERAACWVMNQHNPILSQPGVHVFCAGANHLQHIADHRRYSENMSIPMLYLSYGGSSESHNPRRNAPQVPSTTQWRWAHQSLKWRVQAQYWNEKMTLR